MTDRLPPSYLLALVLALLLGGVVGRLTAMRSLAGAPVVTRPDTRAAVPVLELEGVEGGAVVGRLSGELRVIVRGKLVPVPPGDVRIPLAGLPAVTTVDVPPGMRFVASKRGTKYYELSSSQAAGLTPENRVYFPDAASAEAAGYKK